MFAHASVVHAQTESVSSVAGRVVMPGAKAMQPVADHWVTLHRVGTDVAGPLDSMRTSANGTYRFQFKRTGAADAVYFVSSSYGGVAYFTRPLVARTTSGDDAEIVVFDTTSHGITLGVRGRHVVVTAPLPGGGRRVTEVFELSNDSSRTRIAANDSPEGAVWSAGLPSGARNFNVSDGDLPAAAVQLSGGRVSLFAPFAPGLKQLAFSYTLPSDAFPLRVPAQFAAGVFEVLLEEPQATLRGSPLREVAPVVVQGHHFKRYLAADVPTSTVITIAVPGTSRSVNPWFVAGLIVIIGGAMTVVLARAVRRR